MNFIRMWLYFLTCCSITQGQVLKYPQTKKVKQIDTYHGINIEDPYRWLEDFTSSDVKKWVKKQNELTQNYLNQNKNKDLIHKRLQEIWNYERFSSYTNYEGKYFYSYNSGKDSRDSIYRQSTLSSRPELVLNPNKTLRNSKQNIGYWNPSRNGNYLAYSVSESGSDWQSWYIKDLRSNIILEDRVNWSKFSNIAWDGNSKGFYYIRYPKPRSSHMYKDKNLDQSIYYHKLGTTQLRDKLVFEMPELKGSVFNQRVSEDGQYLIINIFKGTNPNSRVYVIDLLSKNHTVTKLIDHELNKFQFINNNGSKFWFMTTDRAPNVRLVEIDIHNNENQKWKTIIPESNYPIKRIVTINHHFYVFYYQDVKYEIKKHDLNGKFIKSIQLPQLGLFSGFSAKINEFDTTFVYSNTTTPPTLYHFNAITDKATILKQSKIDFDTNQYVINQKFVASKDKTMIPIFVAHHKSIKLNSNNPTLILGYGGFNAAILPNFNPQNLLWLENGGVFVIANIRGGGEYDANWYESGIRRKKQNSFDDFIAVAQWLVREKYTSPKKIAITGRSNGGILMGAVTNQRPDLFAAVVNQVGILDMLRFHRFTIGHAWTSEYGSIDDPQDFKALLAYSPIHNIDPSKNYPAILVTTGDHDDRVVPAHSYKYAASLQEAIQTKDHSSPALLRVYSNAGHGGIKSSDQAILETAEMFTFLDQVLN